MYYCSEDVTMPVRQYKLQRNLTTNVTVQPGVTSREPVQASVSLSPDPTWTFNAQAVQDLRKSTSRLHPDVFLERSTLGNTKEKPPPTCNVTTKRSNTTVCPSQHNVGHYRTCAVVGNSGILLGSDCGPAIDSKDYIIRIDLPAVKGFERDVGRRTNMTVLNMSTPKRLETSSQMTNRSQDVYKSRLQNIDGSVLVADRLSVGKLRRALMKYRLSFVLFISSKRLKMGSGVRSVASGISGKRSVGSPSTGLVTVFMASTFCDQLHLYGFFPFQRDEKKRPVPYHYYPGDSVKPILQAGKHHMSNEYNLYKKLQKRGVLKLQVGKCGKQ
ncbi:alpha-2,8-sialyltransferase 8B-like [Branchiostoma floridae]|uniref:Alpha-2,8-sialyltransferase 8B-like n=1 Tax=Branchiostoma floridae TaxID=7739 RepID=A0A9J7LMA4_BRAFL|nr:alpha-2,8-sialyltransferase 8B-like [Branchiostoma floridae]